MTEEQKQARIILLREHLKPGKFLTHFEGIPDAARSDVSMCRRVYYDDDVPYSVELCFIYEDFMSEPMSFTIEELASNGRAIAICGLSVIAYDPGVVK